VAYGVSGDEAKREEPVVDVAAWLRSLGLEQYAAAFQENAIDVEILPRLTAEDLKDLGVASVGHRRKLLDAIAALRQETPVTDAEPRLAASAATAIAPEAERRQLTVMFADLVGSTALSRRLDPEDMREVIRAYQNACVGVITRFEGFVAKLMGDGVLVYFGWPKADEDDAERAVRAGLALIDAVAQLRTPSGEPLAARVGIATGLVIVGDLVGAGAAQERAVVGETPNLAARLQAVAEPNALVIGPTTRRLVAGLFDCEDLGTHSLKGSGAGLARDRRGSC
jgi:class 3 adenylate cyclase